MPTATGPLAGIRVIELGQVIAGRSAGSCSVTSVPT